jgi:Sec7-like guanine-nucleotide exchange factor
MMGAFIALASAYQVVVVEDMSQQQFVDLGMVDCQYNEADCHIQVGWYNMLSLLSYDDRTNERMITDDLLQCPMLCDE